MLPDECRSGPVRCIDLLDRLSLRCALGDKVADLMIARGIEKHTEDTLSIAKEILRASADNHRRTTGICRLDRFFRDSGDPARIQQMQPLGGRHASFKGAPKKVFENPVYNRIGSPFSPLDRLWRTFGQSRDLLCQPFVPEAPSKATGDQSGNFGCSAAALPLNC